MAGLLDWPDANWTDAAREGYRMIGRSLGRWIYIADAIDDIEKDRKSGAYNLLKNVSRNADSPDYKSAPNYAAIDTARLSNRMTLCLADAAEALELLPIRKNRPILENIIFVGLKMKQDEILANAAVIREKLA